ncbi:MAG: DUF6782 family putative metallopeptidase [Micavibrio sp.]
MTPEKMMETSFISTGAPQERPEVDGMRSERLTRKTYFRKLPAGERLKAEIQAGSQKNMTFDLTLAPRSFGELENSCLFPLSDLLLEARGHADGAREIRIFQGELDALLWCARLMNDSPTARRLCNEAAAAEWSVGLADLKNEGFYIDTEDRVILLDHFSLAPSALGRSAFFSHVLLTTFIRALRDVWHDEQLGAVERDYQPEQILMVERVRAADCDTVTILCGWELRAAGHTEVWRHLLGSEEGDMAIIFSRFLERDPGALFNGAALAYAFRQWYADTNRVDAIDHDTLEALDDILEGSEQPDPFGQLRLSAEILEDLSVLPDGTRYLSGLGGGILRDPFFAGLHDEINQTHLFQMMYDMEVVMVNNVPFRDSALARLIFPSADIVRVR